MSKIEVDAITEQSGTTLTTGGGAGKTVVVDATTVTLGRCGGTVALASGASQTGFGRTGTVDWQTGSVKTATFTAVNGEGYFANTSGGAFTMNLPASPSAGNIVSVKDYLFTFATNNLTIGRNGSNIGGQGSADITSSTNGSALTFIYVDGTQGWLVINESTDTSSGQSPAFVAATGGTITTVCTNFKVHTFTGPGTFCVSNAGNALGSNTVDYLVVAGGGGGGGDDGGGAGAGGYRESSGAATGCYTASPLGSCVAALPVSVTGFTIAVGSGGAGSPGTGTSGSNSTFSSITSTGGGAGGRSPTAGVSGGSGGGGSNSGAAGSGNTPPVSPSQGNNGGTGGSTPNGGGGGGGATVAGQNAQPNPAGYAGGGDGGAGATTSINATPTVRAGGGGGGGFPNDFGSGGTGGGGAGGPAGGAGTVNTGGGAGGGSTNPGSRSGGTGGSGIVIIRYKFQ